MSSFNKFLLGDRQLVRVGGRGAFVTNSNSIEFVPQSLQYSLPLTQFSRGGDVGNDLLSDELAFYLPYEAQGYFAIAANAWYELSEPSPFRRFDLDATKIKYVSYFTPFVNELTSVVITYSAVKKIPLCACLYTSTGDEIRLNPVAGATSLATFHVGDEPKASYTGWTAESRGYLVKDHVAYAQGPYLHYVNIGTVCLNGTSQNRIYIVSGVDSNEAALIAAQEAFPEGSAIDGASVPENIHFYS